MADPDACIAPPKLMGQEARGTREIGVNGYSRDEKSEQNYDRSKVFLQESQCFCHA